jgi:DNA-binding transcriptional ArsR family regulator
VRPGADSPRSWPPRRRPAEEGRIAERQPGEGGAGSAQSAADAVPQGAPSREPLPGWVVESTAGRLRAMATTKSILLLEALSEGETGVQELAERVGLAHQNASYHLALLWRAGVIGRRTLGPATLYAIEDWSVWWVVQQLARWVQSEADDSGSNPSAE